jgi:hypothetical protein
LVVIFSTILIGCQIKKHETEKACRTYGGVERRGLYRVLVGSLRDQLEDLGVNKVMKLICICKK